MNPFEQEQNKNANLLHQIGRHERKLDESCQYIKILTTINDAQDKVIIAANEALGANEKLIEELEAKIQEQASQIKLHCEEYRIINEERNHYKQLNDNRYRTIVGYQNKEDEYLKQISEMQKELHEAQAGSTFTVRNALQQQILKQANTITDLEKQLGNAANNAAKYMDKYNKLKTQAFQLGVDIVKLTNDPAPKITDGINQDKPTLVQCNNGYHTSRQ